MMTRRLASTLGALLVSCAIVQPTNSAASGDSELEAFPPAADGMNRFVIKLEHKTREQEQNYKVEIVAGKRMMTDGVNIQRLGNAIESRTVQGWGYTYYEVTGKGESISTLMAAPEGSHPVEQFVTAPSILVRYNSRLPVVVYAPTGYEIRYRVWQASDTFLNADAR